MFERYTEKANSATLLEVQLQPPELLAAADPSLGEDRALALLKRADLRAEILGRLSKNAGTMKSHKVKLALVQHPNTPRHISIPMLRHLFTFELMQVSAYPGGGRRHSENCRRRSHEPPGNHFFRRTPVACPW